MVAVDGSVPALNVHIWMSTGERGKECDYKDPPTTGLIRCV